MSPLRWSLESKLEPKRRHGVTFYATATQPDYWVRLGIVRATPAGLWSWEQVLSVVVIKGLVALGVSSAEAASLLPLVEEASLIVVTTGPGRFRVVSAEEPGQQLILHLAVIAADLRSRWPSPPRKPPPPPIVA